KVVPDINDEVWSRPGRMSVHLAAGVADKERKNVYSRSKNIGLGGCPGEVCALRSNPSSIDCWLWISGTRLNELVKGTGSVCWHSACDGCSFAAYYGLGHNRHRDQRWYSFPDRSLRSSGEYSGHHSACSCDLHGPSAVWLHLDQAAERQQWKSTVRPTMIRMRSPLYCCHCGACVDGSIALVS